jgi:deoxyadenosine/deoxycytidine kinase
MPGGLIISGMNPLITVVGASGVGKTALVQALGRTGRFIIAYEQHAERPFQILFKQDPRYALANQVDYLLLRANQERALRSSMTGPQVGLMDGGLDLDFHGFSRLFHTRGLLTDPEYDLLRRLYEFIRTALPFPDLIVHLCADEATVAERLSKRDRINIASAEDTALFNAFLEEWLATVPTSRLLSLDVSQETLAYEASVNTILEHLDV